jgi:formate hydrogenlyase subunit 6/NADH:ubiquinone oxidoreductase subunit I
MSYTITDSCTGCTACVRKCPVNAIHGERKAQHHIDPALCIECGACGRICPAHAVLDPCGVPVESIKPNLWPKPVWNYAACVECQICILTCPTGSINLARHGFDGLKPSQPFLIRPATCIACAFCAQHCPTGAILMKIE